MPLIYRDASNRVHIEPFDKETEDFLLNFSSTSVNLDEVSMNLSSQISRVLRDYSVDYKKQNTTIIKAKQILEKDEVSAKKLFEDLKSNANLSYLKTMNSIDAMVLGKQLIDYLKEQ